MIMMKIHNTPSERALRYVDSLIGDRDPSDNRLPPIKTMACNAGVNSATIAKAVARYVQRGILSAKPGAGIRITTPGVAFAPPVAVHESAWKNIRTTLTDDITAGNLHPFPRRKELCTRFKAGYRTINRALTALVEAGVLTSRGRSFTLNETAPSDRGGTILMAVHSEDVGHLVHYTNRSPDLWRMLDHECVRRNLNLRLASFSRILDSTDATRLVRSLGISNLLGHIILLNSIDSSLVQVVDMLAAAGKPVGLFQEYEPETMNTTPGMRRNVRTISIATDREGGRRIAQHLIALGHRRIAYFMYGNADVWAVRRYHGVLDAAESAGTQVRIRCFELNPGQGIFQTQSTLLSQEMIAQVRVAIGGIGKRINPHSPGLDSTISHELERYVITEHVQAVAEPGFHTALKDTAITAWITMSDELGFAALNFLTRNGKKPGTDISVAGFDDVLRSFGTGFTSYNFNITAAVQEVLRFILVKSWRTGQTRRYVSVPGFVVARASTGRV